MSAQGAGRPTRRIAAVVRTAWARLRRGGSRATLALLLGAAFGAPVGAFAFAQPLRAVAGVGSTQSTVVATAFPIPLAVTVTDAQGKPVAGALVTFSAPATGASGRFTVHARGPHHRVRVTHRHTVRVKTDARGIAVAPPFTANGTQGGYIVRATVAHARPTAFALVNEAPGQSQ
ncbi:MAG: hypothetical protein ABSH36_05095 [Solirubrobacteraceae bacterium]